MKEAQALLEDIYKNREDLKKQDEWADSVSKKGFMDKVTIE